MGRSRRRSARAHESTLTNKAELVDALNDLFDLKLDASYDDALDALWIRVHSAHLAWEAAGRP